MCYSLLTGFQVTAMLLSYREVVFFYYRNMFSYLTNAGSQTFFYPDDKALRNYQVIFPNFIFYAYLNLHQS